MYLFELFRSCFLALVGADEGERNSRGLIACSCVVLRLFKYFYYLFVVDCLESPSQVD